MGIELELGVLLAFAILGPAFFSVFELETSPWRKTAKWTFMSILTLILYRFVGHWSLTLPLLLAGAGTTFHIWWCRKNSIDPLRALPRRRYYELRGWKWPE